MRKIEKTDIMQKKLDIQETATERKETIRKKNLNLQENIMQKREALKEQIEQKREAFKDRLEQITDARKKTIVERLDSRLNTINKNRTDHYTKTLERLDMLLDKISTKTAELEAEGANVSSIKTAIATAETALVTAGNAVSAQAAKDYTAQIANETTLRQTIKTVADQLKSDLKATHQTIDAAKRAVKQAAMALAQARASRLTPEEDEKITEADNIMPAVTETQ
jgi:hypothetical protein